MNDLPEYKLERAFDAPLEIVWRAWTEPTILSSWYGPGVETIIHEFDLQPGGVWRNEMKWGDKSILRKMIFQEIVPLKKIVWHHCSADKDWNIAPNPMMPDWPRVLLTTVTFKDKGSTTQTSLTQIPLNATEAEIACFTAKMAGMDKGWGSGYAIMDELLASMMRDTA
jgi:uncharacterized protein YndB with AHSA1/START domain